MLIDELKVCLRLFGEAEADQQAKAADATSPRCVLSHALGKAYAYHVARQAIAVVIVKYTPQAEKETAHATQTHGHE